MEAEEPQQHVLQLQQLAALLQQDKESSYSVTWVPELIPSFVQKAVETVLGPADDSGSPAAGTPDDDPPSSSPSQAPTAPALALGSQHLRVASSSSKQAVDWVMTTCLVPDGLPTAAAAEEAGGLAAMEVVCRLLVLRDCQAAEAPAALSKALSKVRWQQFGLQYKDFFSCDDSAGVLTLGVLPDAVMVPLSLIVCCCNTIDTPSGLADAADTDDAAAADQEPTDPTQTLTQAQTQATTTTAARGNKRRRGGGSRAAPKPHTLSMRRELPLWVGSFESALASLKAQLPEGYMRGRHETLLAGALPPIATNLANIMLRAANTQLKQDSCGLLDCEPSELQERLLEQLQELAAEALALKTAAATQQQRGRQAQQQQQQPAVDVSAAAAALLEARWDEDQGEEDQPEDAAADASERAPGTAEAPPEAAGLFSSRPQEQGWWDDSWAAAAAAGAAAAAQGAAPSHHSSSQRGMRALSGTPLEEAGQLLPGPQWGGGHLTQQQQQQQQQQMESEGQEIPCGWYDADDQQAGGLQQQQQQQQQRGRHPSGWGLLRPAFTQQHCAGAQGVAGADEAYHSVQETGPAAAAGGDAGGGAGAGGGSSVGGAAGRLATAAGPGSALPYPGSAPPMPGAGPAGVPAAGHSNRRRVSGSAAVGLF